MKIEVSFIVPHKGLAFIVDENGKIVFDENGKADPIAVTTWLDFTFNDTEKLYKWLDKESKKEYKSRCSRKIGSGQFKDIVELNMITKQRHSIELTKKHKLRYGIRYFFTVRKV